MMEVLVVVVEVKRDVSTDSIVLPWLILRKDDTDRISCRVMEKNQRKQRRDLRRSVLGHQETPGDTRREGTITMGLSHLTPLSLSLSHKDLGPGAGFHCQSGSVAGKNHKNYKIELHLCWYWRESLRVSAWSDNKTCGNTKISTTIL